MFLYDRETFTYDNASCISPFWVGSPHRLGSGVDNLKRAGGVTAIGSLLLGSPSLRDNADQPWRVLFPDLDWSPPERDL